MTIEVWPHSTFDTYFPGKEEMTADRPCRVQIGGGLIEVTYAEEDGTVKYAGMEQGEGHFALAAPEVGGKATLHRFPKDKFLEGYWCEGQVKGMWRITLAK